MKEKGISSILVIGASGEYFSLADHVSKSISFDIILYQEMHWLDTIVMANQYKYDVVTERAKEIAAQFETKGTSLFAQLYNMTY